MEILLCNTNPVVNRLIKLCAEQVGIGVVCVNALVLEDIHENTIVIVDDGRFQDDIKTVLESTYKGYRVLLVSKGFKSEDLAIFDDIIDKPFLPSRIVDTITSATTKKRTVVEEEISPKEEISSISSTKKTTQILDPGELDKIKQILDQSENLQQLPSIDSDIEEIKIEAFKEHLVSDGVEITNEEEYIQNITAPKPKKYKKLLRSLIDNAIQDTIDRVGKSVFKQAIRDSKVEIDIKIKES